MNRHDLRKNLIGIALMSATALGCMIADILWTERGSALFYALFALGCLLFGILVFILLREVLPVLLLLNRVNMQNNPDILAQIVAKAPRKGSMLSDVFHLVMQLYMHEEKEHKLEALKKEAELYALRSQINPHFLYNTLDSIRGQLIGNDLADVAEIIESLSNLFRYSIDSRTVYNTLEQELDNVRDYMRIMRFRLGDRVSFQVLIDPSEMFILNCEVPKLTLQPIVENAIEHGLAHTAGNGKIILRATAFEDRIAIVVSDNGGGIDPERLEKLNESFRSGAVSMNSGRGTGLALINVHERIRMLQAGEAFGLHINSEVGVGTEVHVQLPIRIMPAEQEAGR